MANQRPKSKLEVKIFQITNIERIFDFLLLKQYLIITLLTVLNPIIKDMSLVS